jgi:hypothetical protein
MDALFVEGISKEKAFQPLLTSIVFSRVTTSLSTFPQLRYIVFPKITKSIHTQSKILSLIYVQVSLKKIYQNFIILKENLMWMGKSILQELWVSIASKVLIMQIPFSKSSILLNRLGNCSYWSSLFKIPFLINLDYLWKNFGIINNLKGLYALIKLCKQ